MTWLKRALPAVFLLAVLATPAAAQIAARPFEFSAGGGIFAYDTRARLKDGPSLGGSLGWRLASWVTAEVAGTFGTTDSDTMPKASASFGAVTADLRFNLRPAEDRVVPYLITGLGAARSVVDRGRPETLERGVATLGAGALFNLRANPRLYLRLQARDLMFREREQFEFSHHVTAQVAIHYVLRGRIKDIDLDGVRDWIDRCPETPVGATVDASGCPKDSDGDGVLD